MQLLESLHDISACIAGKGAHPNYVEKINVIMTLVRVTEEKEEERVREAERMAEGRLRDAEGRVREAEERVGESERLIREVRSQGEERVREAQQQAQASEERARKAEIDVAAERQWVVERREIHITEDVLGVGGWGGGQGSQIQRHQGSC